MAHTTPRTEDRGPDSAPDRLPDFRPAPNQGANPELYDVENRAIDPDGLVLEAMRTLAPWQGRTLIDLGCGSGFWLPGYAGEAASVIGVEPDHSLLPLAAERDPRAAVLHGSAEHIPLSEASADVIHARFAYFWPPNCAAGLTEALRVLRPGGALVVVDNDYRDGEFASLLKAAGYTAQGGPGITDSWWAGHGAERTAVRSEWRFGSNEDLAAVLRMEFPMAVADAWLADHPDAVGMSYGYVLFTTRKPS